jgi:rhodanese-related sulfurtransferase
LGIHGSSFVPVATASVHPAHPVRASTTSYCGGMAAERIDVATAHAMWRAGDTVIDVRTPDEYAGGHIAGALNVPIGVIAYAARDLPEGPIITACSLGGRAGRAAELLDLAGRTAFSIAGGTKAWQAAGHPVRSGLHPGKRR